MNLGLGNLTELKRHLLNEALQDDRYNDAIGALGRGVAARFEQYCNRRFERQEGAAFEARADVESCIVDRYPVETITSLHLRETRGEGWVAQSLDAIENLTEASGLVRFGSRLSTRHTSRLKLTYTGGYWFATSALPTIRCGTIALAEGDELKAVAFDTAFSAQPFVFARVRTPGTALLFDVVTLDVRRSGFSVALGALAPAAGYVVDYIAIAQSSPENGLTVGTVDLVEGSESQVVAFTQSFKAAPLVFCALQPPAGGTVIAAAPSSVTAAGFTARFATPIESGTRLAWLAIDPDALKADDIGRVQGSALLSTAAESLAVSFDTAFSATPFVFAQLVTPDGTIVTTAASARSAAGFTVQLAASAPAGSTLAWVALPASVSAMELPAGAAAVPADLKLAWLLQCEFIWKIRDKLGTDIAGGGGDSQLVSLTLAGAKLIPEVQEILDRHRRYALV